MGLKRFLKSIVSPVEEVKASRSLTYVSVRQNGRAVWTPRDYAALAKEGYMKNPVAYRAVRMIAQAAANTPMILSENHRDLQEHPLLDLLATPHAGETLSGLLEALYGHLLTAGNAYLEAVSVGGNLRELHVLRPDRVKVVPGQNGWVEAHEYTVGGRAHRLQRQEGDVIAPLLHIKSFHPLNDHYGFAPLEAAQTSLDTHNAASSWNKALLDNAACPTGALVYGAGETLNLTDSQFNRLKEELHTSYQGASNAGRPLLLEGGLDWKPMGMTPKDMDFIAAKNQASREIALALGVPPMLLGIPGDNTYSTYQEANRAFWRQVVLPLSKRVLDAISSWVCEPFNRSLKLRVDLDKVEALSSERSSLWNRVSAADFLTEDEKRQAVGYGPKETSSRPHE
ncbi:phage portal protein [Flexibacterium corallicola]|uniref:phage portal protein n=1 Tax=Flexibacterium corallicola TaxID=3037259 RepID=UPI00286F24DA|nr:phage portal protein [Pseudovibrio sp. M1P-2-3]